MRSKRGAVAKDGAILTAILGVLIGGTWGISELTVGRLLHNDAVSTGQTWASYLAKNVEDLEEIAGGAKPSPESQRFFDRVRQVGQVFRYIIYDPEGHTRLVSDTLDVDDDDEDLAKHNPAAATAIAGGQPLINVEEGQPPTRPPFFAEAYVPVVAKGKTVAIVEVYVDQTEKRNDYRRTFLAATAALGLLIGLAFGLPAIAWRRGVNKKRLADEHIRFLANHDSLTSLPNRNHLTAKIGDALADLPRQGGRLAMHCINIDHFKDINDTLGHSAGDELIQAIAERLRALAPVYGVAARSGGDEFVLLQTAPASVEDALKLSKTVSEALSRPYAINGEHVSVTASIGVAMAPEDGDSAARLMKSADLALDRAKSEGGAAIQFYSSDMEAELNQRLRLERIIRDAVVGDRFQLNFQPVVEMPERRLVGFEALLRLRDDLGAPIPPTIFIPIAEQMGLITAIGTWVLRQACKTATDWPAHLKVAVNLSPAQFADGNLSEIVGAALTDSGLEPHRLELEITEGLLLGDGEAVLSELRKLKAMQVGIVMDDFGTGYSSLSYLWKFPFDKLKIDRAFMLALDADDPGSAETIVKTIIDLGRTLNMTVTVEGVENERQVNFVEAARGDQIHGYYFARPLPVNELAPYILRQLKDSVYPAKPSPDSALKATRVAR
jgi:diguanylate cyclase (GGDEF)-like protein